MRVRELMTGAPVTVRPDTPMLDPRHLMLMLSNRSRRRSWAMGTGNFHEGCDRALQMVGFGGIYVESARGRSRWRGRRGRASAHGIGEAP